MNTLFSVWDPLEDGYRRVYDALWKLREGFHRAGRLDDSNAKLDETSKLFATYLAFKNNKILHFPSPNSHALMSELHAAFASTARLPQYCLANGNSIFGSNPALILREEDQALAKDLVRLVCECVDLAFDLQGAGRPFDILNEAFGHFVRDNFRGNVEDAQYMTPPEVVDFMVDMVLYDLAAEDASAREVDKHWTILDPSCGVGSFLTAVYHRARRSNWLDPHRLRLFGQDKVERMVRLATINLELFDVEDHRITLGNSLENGSPIDALNDRVDIILTNPPFGARFDWTDIPATFGDNTPFFSSLRRATGSIDSELLFIDRNLRALREGGRLLIVVPDGVVSSKGMAAMLRQHLGATATLRAVVELPSTTFAQAGTRTKTAVLYLQKGRGKNPRPVFMGVSSDLGFQVSSRKGVQIKVSEGQNDLPAILATYQQNKPLPNNPSAQILRTVPSCVAVSETTVLKGSWTPNHFNAERYESIHEIGADADMELVRLRDVVDFCSEDRRTEGSREGWAFISVLHVLGEGLINVRDCLTYAPKTPGILTKPGELLISRINPRIPRVCVTPDLGTKTLCSSEFEVMKVRASYDLFAIAFILQLESVQLQVRSLTSGTSASHNRIRTSELAQVLLPIPKTGTEKARKLSLVANEYRQVIESLAKNATALATLRATATRIFCTSDSAS